MVKNTTKSLIIIICLSIVVISSWIFLIVPNFKKIAEDYQVISVHEGQNRIVKSWGEPISEPFSLKEVTTQKVTNVDGDVLTIESNVTGYDVTTEEIVFRSSEIFLVDRFDYHFLDTNQGIFVLPTNTEKTNYLFTDTFVPLPVTLIFDSVDLLSGHTSYIFTWELEGINDSEVFPQFAPRTVLFDGDGKLWIDPVTGMTLRYEHNWEDYIIENGQRILVDVGNKHSTPDDVLQHIEIAKNKAQVFFFYDNIIPILLTIIMIGIPSVLLIQRTMQAAQTKNLELDYRILKQIDKQKEEFSSMITHELKTPLTPIRGYCEMLKDESFGILTKDQIHYAEKIDSNAMLLERLIGDVLDVQKLDMEKMSFNKESFAVCDFLDRLKQDSSHLMKDKGIEFVVANSVKATLKTDQLRLQQVLENLIRNSVDFVPLKNGKIEVGAKQENGKIIFHVKDNGVGITKDKQQNIFKKFYQVDTSLTRKHGGTGLGLVICRGIVNALGGEIWFESEPGIVTTFYFSVPIYIEKITMESKH